MIFRIYHRTVGGHVHMRFFAGRTEGALGKCGDLVMRVEEFVVFRQGQSTTDAAACIDFREEDNGR
jgi:hypothetical protein